MQELLICSNEKYHNICFCKYNKENIYVWSGRIEEKNLYAIVKYRGRFEILKVIGMADFMNEFEKDLEEREVVQLLEMEQEEKENEQSNNN